MTPNEDKWAAISDAQSNDVETVVEVVREQQDGQWAEGYRDPTWGLGRDLRVFVRVEGGEWTGLLVVGEPGKPVTLETIRDSRLGDLVGLAVEISSTDWEAVTDAEDEELKRALQYRPTGRVRLTEFHLRQVVLCYRTAQRVAPDRPQSWLAEWWGVSPVRVSRWISAARERGLLEEGE